MEKGGYGLTARDWAPSPALHLTHWFSGTFLSIPGTVTFMAGHWISSYARCFLFAPPEFFPTLPVPWTLPSKGYMSGLPCFLAPYCVLCPVGSIEGSEEVLILLTTASPEVWLLASSPSTGTVSDSSGLSSLLLVPEHCTLSFYKCSPHHVSWN
jgi:hypothetical protein